MKQDVIRLDPAAKANAPAEGKRPSTTPSTEAVSAEPRLPKGRALGAILGFLMAVILPTALAAGYYWGVAADRFVTEFRFAVRGGATLPSNGGDMLSGSGALVYAADSFILEDYLLSVQALLDAERHAPVREMLGRDGDDPVRGYDASAPLEDLAPFWASAVYPSFDALTGITTVSVSLFSPQDSLALSRALITEMRTLVEGLSAEARSEMRAYVDQELQRAKDRLDGARAALEAFRRENSIVDPSERVTIGSRVMGELSNELAERQVELQMLRDQSPGNPRIPTLENTIAALRRQLEQETQARGSPGDGQPELPSQLTDYDRLIADYEIAREIYASTLNLRQQVEAYAALGRPELVVFVPPRAPHLSTRPNRALETLKIFGVAAAVWVIGRVILASVRG